MKNPLRCRRTCPHLLLVDDDPRARTLPSLPGRAPIAECQERAHLALIGLRPPAADPLHQYGMSPRATCRYSPHSPSFWASIKEAIETSEETSFYWSAPKFIATAAEAISDMFSTMGPSKLASVIV
jgi:hypothetical protein